MTDEEFLKQLDEAEVIDLGEALEQLSKAVGNISMAKGEWVGAGSLTIDCSHKMFF